MDINAYQHMRISTRGKRPLRNLTPGDKVRAIQRIHNGETKASVSRDIGVPESTLRGWCKNEQKLRFMCRQLGAAISDQGMPIAAGIDNPPEKRSKLAEAFDFNHSYGYDRLGSLNAVNRLNAANLNMDSKNNYFINNNVIEELMKKNGTSKDETNKQIFGDSAFLQGMNALSAATNYSQLPLIQNMNVLSFLNPSLAIPAANAGSKTDCVPPKTSLRANAIPKEVISKPKKQLTPVSVKSWAHESLCSPLDCNDNNPKNGISDMIDTNDSNNNDVRPMHALTPSISINDFSESASPNLFPIGMPLPNIPTVSAEVRSDVLLQWSKVFNASLSFLALATAAAAIQCPTSVSPSTSSSTNETKCDITTESSYLLHNPPARSSSYTPPPIFEHSEDSNFESEPEDLSVRSGTSKVSSSGNSRPQSPTKDMMSDSLTLSDDEN